MKSRKTIILPKYQESLQVMGENIKLARLRRKLKSTEVAERANIARSTLYLIENGDPSVSMGSYFNVLKVFSLHRDLLDVAKHDILGYKLMDIELLTRDKKETDAIIQYGRKLTQSIIIGLYKGSFNESIKSIVGIDSEELLSKLNNNPYGFKFGAQLIEIEHIKPLSKGMTKGEMEELNHWSNLQLLPKEYNILKNTNEWDESHFINWFKNY